MVKNPNSTVNQIDTSLADFDALIMTQFQLVAAIAEMPVTKLMKTCDFLKFYTLFFSGGIWLPLRKGVSLAVDPLERGQLISSLFLL